jgi:hypothetical protein
MAAGAAAGLACGLIPAVVELVRPREPPGNGLSMVAACVFVGLGSVPWAPTWIALWQRHATLDTMAWWASVIAFGTAAAVLRRRWPSMAPLLYLAAIGVGGWQGMGFARTAMSSSCTGDDPVYAGVAFGVGTLGLWVVGGWWGKRLAQAKT